MSFECEIDCMRFEGDEITRVKRAVCGKPLPDPEFVVRPCLSP